MNKDIYLYLNYPLFW